MMKGNLLLVYLLVKCNLLDNWGLWLVRLVIYDYLLLVKYWVLVLCSVWE